MFWKQWFDRKWPKETHETADLYIETEGQDGLNGGTIRFFFTEKLIGEDARSIEVLLKRQLRFLQRFNFSPSRHSIALSWVMKYDEYRNFDEVETDVRIITIGALSAHFGWHEPRIATFRNSEERIALMRKLRIE